MRVANEVVPEVNTTNAGSSPQWSVSTTDVLRPPWPPYESKVYHRRASTLSLCYVCVWVRTHMKTHVRVSMGLTRSSERVESCSCSVRFAISLSLSFYRPTTSLGFRKGKCCYTVGMFSNEAEEHKECKEKREEAPVCSWALHTPLTSEKPCNLPYVHTRRHRMTLPRKRGRITSTSERERKILFFSGIRRQHERIIWDALFFFLKLWKKNRERFSLGFCLDSSSSSGNGAVDWCPLECAVDRGQVGRTHAKDSFRVFVKNSFGRNRFVTFSLLSSFQTATLEKYAPSLMLI